MWKQNYDGSRDKYRDKLSGIENREAFQRRFQVLWTTIERAKTEKINLHSEVVMITQIQGRNQPQQLLQAVIECQIASDFPISPIEI